MGPSITISGTHHPRPPLQHSQAGLKSPPRPESVTSPSPSLVLLTLLRTANLTGLKRTEPHTLTATAGREDLSCLDVRGVEGREGGRGYFLKKAARD